MKKRTKNKVLKTITIISLIINSMYFGYIAWTGNAVRGIFIMPWMLSIAWLILFVLANLDKNWLGIDKRKRGSRASVDNSKYYFTEEK